MEAAPAANEEDTMGRQIQIGERTEEHEEDKTIRELKEELGIPLDKSLTYDDGTGTYELHDGDTVGGVPEGSTVASLPDSGRLFG